MSSLILPLLKEAIRQNASDVHLIAGEKPMCRKEGELEELDASPLPERELEEDIMELLSSEQKKQWKETLELDMALSMGDIRFRLNIHQQERKIGLSARVIPRDIPTMEALHFEPFLHTIPQIAHGLVLVVGPTGSGKSTTIAAFVEAINQSRKSHIITIEDPIEFIFHDKQSLIEQREVGVDTQSFGSALKHVLRQDPNVIVVGEMRDPETIATVLTAAETGHLVFSTLHTSSAAEAIERIVDVFDGAKQKQVLIQLAAVLRVVIAQQLLPGQGGKRVPAREILVNTPAISNLIRENNIAQIGNAMQTGRDDGMITMRQAIAQLA
ncbi:MAG: PilT/PilU family type 4a pilus ATPase [Patescibacteria group bacterium]